MSVPWVVAQWDRVYDSHGVTHILDGASGHSVIGGFHVGNRQGCPLCRDNHWHNCTAEGVDCGVTYRFRQAEAKAPHRMKAALLEWVPFLTVVALVVLVLWFNR